MDEQKTIEIKEESIQGKECDPLEEKKDNSTEVKANKKFISNDLFIGLFLLMLSVAFGAQTLSFKGTSKYFPIAVFSIFAILSLAEVFIGIKQTIDTRRGTKIHTNPKMKGKPFMIFLGMLVYIYSFSKIGFFVSSAIFLPIMMLVYGQRNWKAITFTTVGVLAFLYWLFVVSMKLVLPKDTLLF